MFLSRGVWPSCPTTRNEAVDKKGKQGLIIPVYLLQLLNELSTPLVCFMVVSHDTSPPNPFPTAAFRRLCIAASSASETMFNNSSHRTFSPCCSITFLLIGGIELTANQCQSVNRSAVPLGCWV